MSQIEENGVKKGPKILIIGAGLAGISCAEYLIRNGLTDIKVLEASNRTGGRIWSVDVDKTHKTEMGATYIQGIERNPIYTIAHANHLLELRNKTLRHKSVFVMEKNDNSVVSERMAKDLDWMYGRLLQSAEDFYTMGLPTEEENASLGEYLDRSMEEHLTKYPKQEQRLRRMIFHQRVLLECMVTGCNSLADVSLSEWGCYQELPGIHYSIPPGFESILEILKLTIPHENMHLNHIVTNIEWGRCAADIAQTTSPRSDICVTCKNGAQFYADFIVVTVSLGVLKHCAREVFTPRLPNEKLLSIDHLGFGVVDKVLVEFDEPIVSAGVSRIELLWEDLCEDTRDVSETWYRKFFSFDVIYEHYLLGWLSGEAATFMETLTDDQIMEAIVKILKIFLKKDIPWPKRVIRSKWGDNKFTYGAYSYIAVGSHADDIDLLAEPLHSQQCPSKPQVMFAGEATHRIYYSTTHGALISGQREAQRILDYTDS